MITRNIRELKQVLVYRDYYPFGWKLPGRTYTSGAGYRYGFQGEYAERDEETGWSAFELRSYDGRVGRWMSIDPYEQYWSPYVAFGNAPQMRVDPDGGFAGTLLGGLVGAGIAAWRGDNILKGAVSGMAAGAVFDAVYTGGASLGVLVLAGAASGATGNLVDQAWDLLAGKQSSFNLAEFGLSIGIGGILGPIGKYVSGAVGALASRVGTVFQGLLRKPVTNIPDLIVGEKEVLKLTQAQISSLKGGIGKINSLEGKSIKWLRKNKPKGWKTIPTRNNEGFIWLDKSGIERLRFMRPNGKNPTNSQWSRQANGYFRWTDESGNFLDVNGNVVPRTDPLFNEKTHIIYEGIWR